MPTAVAGPARNGVTSWAGSASGSRPREGDEALRGSAFRPVRPPVRLSRRDGVSSAPRARTLGNYRQHITFAGCLGVAYAWAAYVLAGIHWMYGSVAALLATLSGLLPDLDSPS